MMNVLVIDDSAIVRTMIRRAIGASGLAVGEVFEAENGRAALDLLVWNRIDAVFVDLHMPVMNGAEFVEQLARDGRLPELPVFVLSTDRGDDVSERLRALGVREYLVKPLQPETLEEVITQHVSPDA